LTDEHDKAGKPKAEADEEGREEGEQVNVR
jgi:hypothetical protein